MTYTIKTHIYSRVANGKNCALFHTSAKFGVLIRYSDVYLLRQQLSNWLALFPNLISIQKRKQKRSCWHIIKKLKKLVGKNALITYMFLLGQNNSLHMKKLAKLRKIIPFQSPDDTSVMGYNRSKIKEKLVAHELYTKGLFEHEL